MLVGGRVEDGCCHRRAFSCRGSAPNIFHNFSFLMNLDHAPKFFWAALSVSLLLLTGSLLIIAYRASSVSVEFADAKVQLANDKIQVSQIAANTEDLLKSLQEHNQQLEQAKSNLEARLAQLERSENLTNASANIARPELIAVSRAVSNVSSTLPSQEKITQNLNRLETIQQSLRQMQ